MLPPPFVPLYRTASTPPPRREMQGLPTLNAVAALVVAQLLALTLPGNLAICSASSALPRLLCPVCSASSALPRLIWLICSAASALPHLLCLIWSASSGLPHLVCLMPSALPQLLCLSVGMRAWRREVGPSFLHEGHQHICLIRADACTIV